MGRVGKTTLMTQINNHLERSPNDFEVVIWAVVSRGHTIENVQHEIGKACWILVQRKWRENKRET